MLDTESRLSTKTSMKRLNSKPLKDLSINTSEPSLSKPISLNSPKSSGIPRKSSLFSKHPMTAPTTPKQLISINCRTPKAVSSKIKSPSNYVFSTHNHSNKFALTPKRTISQKTLIQPKEKIVDKEIIDKEKSKERPSERVASLITKTSQTKQINKQKEHLFNTFQAIKVAKGLREPTIEELIAKQVKLSKKRGFERRKTVIFDLDETLVHCTSSNEVGHVEIEIEFPLGVFTKISLNIRPFVKELLSSVSKDFEVIIFTASHKCYADKVINFLDPEGQWVHHRLYRNNCIQIDGIYVKDLRILCDRNIKDMIIVDNAAYSFAFQVNNGIPIISWYSDLEDRELFKLADYLRVLSRVEDVRAINQFTFHLDTFYEDYIRDFMANIDKENFVAG